MPYPKKTFSNSQLTDILSSHKNGESGRSIAKRLNTSRDTIYRTLREAGVSVHHGSWENITTDIVHDIISSYKSGESARSIANRHGWDKGRVERILNREAAASDLVFRVRPDYVEPGYKACKGCGESKHTREFVAVRGGWLGVHSHCTECTNSKHQKTRLANPIKTMLQTVKARAKKKGIRFDLTETDISIPDICPLLGIPMMKGNGKAGINSPSLDRIDPNLGYIRGNVWVISHRANTIKQNATLAEIELLAQNLRQKINP